MALLTAQQLAEELGFTVKFVRRLALTGAIPSERYGSEWRFDLSAVRAAAQRVTPVRRAIQDDAMQAAARACWRMTPKRRAL